MRLPLTIDFPEHCAGGRSILGSIPRCQFDSIFVFFNSITERPIQCAAGVVVSCKIPILATRVRFPGDATFLADIVFTLLYVHFLFKHFQYQCPRGLMDKASVS